MKDGTIVTIVFSAQKEDWLQRLSRLPPPLLLVEDEEDTIIFTYAIFTVAGAEIQRPKAGVLLVSQSMDVIE